MKKIQCIIGITLIALMTIGSSLPIYAQEAKGNKEETVYMQLDASGRLKKATVVNAFEAAKNEVVDYGQYESIVNLSSDSIVSQVDDVIRFGIDTDADAAIMFYYQGDVVGAVNPWLINISYALGGKSIAAETLGNARGKLEIQINVKRNPLSKVAFADQYTLQITAVLNDDVASNIEAAGASVVTVGSNKQIAITVLPKQQKLVMIKADVNAFKMDSITATGFVSNFDLDFDTQAIEDGFNNLSSGSKNLKEGMVQFEAGLVTTADAVSTFNSHLKKIASGGNKLLDGNSQFELGLGSLVTKGEALTLGFDSVISRLVKASASNDAVTMLATQLLQNPDPSVQKLAQAALGQIQLNTGSLNALKELNTGLVQYTQGVSTISQSHVALSEGLKSYVGSNAGIVQAFNKFNDAFKKLPNQYDLLIKGQSQLDAGIVTAKTKLTSTMETLPFSTNIEKTSVMSYTSDKNKPHSVQFVMKTPSIDYDIVQDIIPEKIIKRTFLERLMDLFL